jgi:catechol 2,3-dioxygenase-like lactoylglutathione lyase family enzyme
VPALGSHYHVGIVVADIESARERLADRLGVTWGPVLHLDSVSFRDGNGTDLELPNTICYSTGNPALELVQETPGSVWVRNEHSNLHHIGFWTDGLAGDSAALGPAGCPLQLCGRSGDVAPVSFAYHRDEELGFRFELVDVAIREAMAFLFQPDSGA